MDNNNKIDSFFLNNQAQSKIGNGSRRERLIRQMKVWFPVIAAVLVGVLLLYPAVNSKIDEFKLDITLPKKGELEKLHVENTVFYITDSKNMVSDFRAKNIDETEAGSKLIKFEEPDGILPLSNGGWIKINAPTGFYDQKNNLLRLIENVSFFYNDGMEGNTAEVFYDFNKSAGYGNQKISGSGVLGNFEAGSFTFSANDNVLILKNKPKVIIFEDAMRRKKQ